MSDYYKILNVSKKATIAEIKKSYRKLARKYHPDLNPGDKVAEKKFKEITEAYEVLKDPKKKKQYDTFGSAGPNFNSSGKRPDFTGFDFNTTGSSSFGDIFETIFGNFGGDSQRSKSRTKKPQRGEDLHYAMNISFIDSVKGIEAPIQIFNKVICSECKGEKISKNSKISKCLICNGTGKVERQTGFMRFASPCTSCGGTGHTSGDKCKTCNGEGRIGSNSKLKVKIPAGVENNSKIRLTGKGNSGFFGGKAGDLIITISVTPHKFYKRRGYNLEIELPVTFREAALGSKIEVPTIEGKALLKIPPSTSSGQKLRLKNRGIPNPKTGSKGDMFIVIKIVPPSTKDIEVREMLKRIEEKAPYNPRKEFEW